MLGDVEPDHGEPAPAAKDPAAAAKDDVGGFGVGPDVELCGCGYVAPRRRASHYGEPAQPLGKGGVSLQRLSDVGQRPHRNEMKAFDAMAGLNDEPGRIVGFDRTGDRRQFHVAKTGGTVHMARASGFGHQGPSRAPVHVNVELGDLGHCQGVAGGVFDAHIATDSRDPDQISEMRCGQQGKSVVKSRVAIHQHRNGGLRRWPVRAWAARHFKPL